ncbi:hypothetical protein [Actinokineospora sp. NBRC 105648]|uniref:SecDF P1 head subdomain-containing protein n=1 Tax=Actinokineospora sp. NBRC 105648 TaxID=3032206 RepID=UPI0024A0C2DD|nr:hypothetical protein [Actinokineospora sp. NBRC 105648]GLZ36785.1 hypothetical protein Acsp05_04100 [Actinokineospora sp. NBRC 105648]
MRTPLARLLTALLLFALAACGSDTVPGKAAAEPGSGPVQTRVPVDLRPVTAVAQGTEPTGPDEFAGDDGSLYTVGPSIADISRLEDVKAESTENGTGWVVTIKLSADAAAKFGSWTAEHVGERLAIVVDGKLVSAPQIASPIPGGEVQISGNFTEKSAKQLAADISGK